VNCYSPSSNDGYSKEQQKNPLQPQIAVNMCLKPLRSEVAILISIEEGGFTHHIAVTTNEEQ